MLRLHKLSRHSLFSRLMSFRLQDSAIVLGIETSCDDTGCAVVQANGKILGESLYSQNTQHVRYGGINPLFARDMHRDNIELAVKDALTQANVQIADIDAIAVTVKPGLIISLEIGVKYAKYLSKKFQKPLIPIHHMEAHALTARIHHEIPFPFLVLLISGGHCLLALVNSAEDYLLLGESMDNAPGEVMDKAARRMKLKYLPEYSKLAGGHAIELAARKANNHNIFQFPLPLVKNRDCNFSFSGLRDSLFRKVEDKEHEHGIIADGIIPEVNDLCAAFQLGIAEHIAHRTKRAMIFCEEKSLLGDNKCIVVSGGVACNNFIYRSIEFIGKEMGYKVFRPHHKLCTDNGIMIAWNAIERLKNNNNITNSSNNSVLYIEPKAPLGQNYIDIVKSADLYVKATRLKTLYDNT